MNLKVYSKKHNIQEGESGEKVPQEEASDKGIFYETPKLLRQNGIYYIGYETDKIQIEEWEAIQVYEHPETVYDVIVSYRRKYYFNTAEDSISSLFH